jgi:myo-inositol-1(or 4)-monophosphatase
MLSYKSREKIKKSIIDFFEEKRPLDNLQVYKKEKNSPVTEVDYFICKQVKKLLQGQVNHNYFSEEDHGVLDFPAAIVDPIDGTKGLLYGLNESALSLALMESEQISGGWGWVYNPFTGLSLCSEDLFYRPSGFLKKGLLGLVSRTEWERGNYQSFTAEDFTLAPKGSIAFKLALLASGGCDFVSTRSPKNIWDIAAGTILCERRGIELYGPSGKMEYLGDQQVKAPMLWCRREYFERLKGLLE